MYYTIYQVKNIINNKTYIGKHQTKDLNDNYFGSGKILKQAIAKHGKENFIKEILFIYDSEAKMNLAEKILVVPDKEISYNLCEGGQGGFGYILKSGIKGFKGKSHSETHKEYIRNLYKDKPIPNETKVKISLGLKSKIETFGHNWTGKKHREETKILIGLANSIKLKGENNPNYGKCWINNNFENKCVPKNDLDSWLEKGYSKGRKMNIGP